MLHSNLGTHGRQALDVLVDKAILACGMKRVKTIVIGGGVLKSAHKIFWTTMMQSAKQHAWPEAFRTTEIVRSGLRGRVGDLGALALVFQQ